MSLACLEEFLLEDGSKSSHVPLGTSFLQSPEITMPHPSSKSTRLGGMQVLPLVYSLLKKLSNIKTKYVITLTLSGFNRNSLRNTRQRLASIPKTFSEICLARDKR